jgi:hypothetical protein
LIWRLGFLISRGCDTLKQTIWIQFIYSKIDMRSPTCSYHQFTGQEIELFVILLLWWHVANTRRDPQFARGGLQNSLHIWFYCKIPPPPKKTYWKHSKLRGLTRKWRDYYLSRAWALQLSQKLYCLGSTEFAKNIDSLSLSLSFSSPEQNLPRAFNVNFAYACTCLLNCPCTEGIYSWQWQKAKFVTTDTSTCQRGSS